MPSPVFVGSTHRAASVELCLCTYEARVEDDSMRLGLRVPEQLMVLSPCLLDVLAWPPCVLVSVEEGRYHPFIARCNRPGGGDSGE